MTEYDPGSSEGIPSSGVERLEQNREGLYTSDLSVSEFLLVTQAEIRPGRPGRRQLDLPHWVPGCRARHQPRHGWGSHVIEFFALGTAIVSTSPGTRTQIEPPVPVLDLNDRWTAPAT